VGFTVGVGVVIAVKERLGNGGSGGKAERDGPSRIREGGNTGGYSDRGYLIRELSRAVQGSGAARVVYSDLGCLSGGLSRGSWDDGSRSRTNEAQGDITSLSLCPCQKQVFTCSCSSGMSIGLLTTD